MGMYLECEFHLPFDKDCHLTNIQTGQHHRNARIENSTQAKKQFRNTFSQGYKDQWTQFARGAEDTKYTLS